MDIKVGDQVLLPSYGGVPVKLSGDKEFHLFGDHEIVGLLDEKEIV